MPGLLGTPRNCTPLIIRKPTYTNLLSGDMLAESPLELVSRNLRTKIMDGKGTSAGIVPKPTGANKRKGQNPVKQIVQDVSGGGRSSGSNGSERSGLEIGPLDLSVCRQQQQSEEQNGVKSVSPHKKVILSVPTYKSVTTNSHLSPKDSSGQQVDSMTSFEQGCSLSVTPVFKSELLDPEDFEATAVAKSDLSKNSGNFALNTLLSNQTQSFFSLEHFKQASLIFQKHALNGNTTTECLKNEFLQHSIWNNLVSSTVAASESISDEKRKIHKCDFPSCDKVYTKSSHLKAHKREYSSLN